MNRIRCAIYTRKSTDEGLEQEFNSLDAQREACEAFIASQRGLGWVGLGARYDDGGLSGGTMDRPALQRLLAEIDQGRVDLVVVYKVDRLTRSLFDFAKIIQAFEAKNVSFVSVTQAFNTSTSMGRLTLNVLLSFAQFEREVTAERIRDKVAASKKKGMWMGGPIPLGYDSKDKKLIVNEAEAAVVRRLFDLYLQLRNVDKLKQEADRLGLVTKQHMMKGAHARGGTRFGRGNLYQMLRNPIYVGEIAHKGNVYQGQHQAIIERDVWDSVQLSLAGNAANRRSSTNTTGTSLLTGLVFDETGDRLSPTFAVRNGKRHYYYVSQRLFRTPGRTGTGWRIPAKQLEDAVRRAICDFLGDHIQLSKLATPSSPRDMQRLLRAASDLASRMTPETLSENPELIRKLVHRITLSSTSIKIEMSQRSLWDQTIGPRDDGADESDGFVVVEVPAKVRRRGIESKLVLRSEGAGAPDERLIGLIARSHRWLDQLTSGEMASIREIAQRDGTDEADVSRFLPLAFLAPDIVEAIVLGKQPMELTMERLRRTCPLPFSWDAQHRRLVRSSS